MSSEYDELPAGIRSFEPRGALVAGPRGTEIIERLLPQAAARLADGGHLLIEVSPMIHDAVCRLIAADSRLLPQTTIKDLAGHPRVVSARKGHS